MRDKLRLELCKHHLELFANGLVSCSSGNVSVRIPSENLIMIKPSGIEYQDLTPESMVIVSMTGEIIEGHLNPSIDTATHLHIYRHRQDINGIVHTHSTYATAFAAVGRSIPPVLTAIADEFGGPIPCGNYAPVGGESIGREIIRCIGTGTAVLLKHHGVFTIGASVKAAIRAAIRTEENAKIVYLASQLDNLQELAPEEVARARQTYIEKYGQNCRKKLSSLNTQAIGRNQ